MPARFTTLNNAIEKGLKSMAAKTAVSQIEYWEDQLKKLLASLAEKTKNISGRVEDEKVAQQLEGVADGLEKA